MAENIGTATVTVRPDTGNFEREAHSKLGGAFGGIAKAGVAAFAVVGVAAGAFGVKAVTAAADLNETISKVGVVFGQQADQITTFANQMASDFGLPKRAILDAAASLGLVGKAAGLAVPEATNMAQGLAKIAADASSFYNVPLEEALVAIQSGLVGEAEPLRRFGVLLSEAAVKAEAARLGIAATGTELTEQQKTMARSSLITKGFADATGDLERTQGSFANQMRAFRGDITNLAADLGQKLLPAAQSLLGAFRPMIDVVGNTLGGAFVALAPAITAIAPVMASFGSVIAKIAAVLGPILTEVIKVLSPVIGVLAEAFGQILIALLPLLPPLAQLLVALSPLIPPLAKLIVLLVDLLVPILTPLIGLLAAVATVLATGLAKGIEWVVKGLSWLIDRIKELWSWVGDKIVVAFELWKKGMEPIQRVLSAIGGFIGSIIDAVKKLIDWFLKLNDKLPEWLKPGSPSPLETALAGIGDQMRKLNRMEPLTLGVGSLSPAGGGVTIASGAVQLNFSGPVTPETVPVIQQNTEAAFRSLLQTLEAGRV